MVGVFISLFALFILSIVIIAAISSTKPTVQIQKNSILKIELSGSIVEQATENPINFSIPGLPLDIDVKEQGLDHLLKAIDLASKNPKIEGIYLNVGIMEAGWTTVDEIRNALKQFKKTGKFIYAYGGMIGQKEYFISSVSDSIFINPEGMIQLSGLTATPVFYKNALDKMGVKAEIFRVGTYKSAVEPYINTKMSEAARNQTTTYLNGIWSYISKEISVSRKIKPEQINRLADENTLFMSTLDLKKEKLADRIVYESEANRSIEKRLKNKPQFVTIDAVLNDPSQPITFEKENIAVLYAAGEIYDSGNDGVVEKKMLKVIEEIQQDSTIKAVVFRVNSPGGSAYASEQIWKSIHDLNKQKPVIVSMGDYAASGGYYISSGASKIIASPTTITGSIGVFGMYFNIDELTNKIGVNIDVVKTNANGDLGNMTRPMTQMERAKIQQHVNRTYDLFIKRCADGRNMGVQEVKRIAEGRVWTGTQAKELGLADALGGIDFAIQEASKMSKTPKYNLVYYPKKKDFLAQLVEDLSEKTQYKVAKMLLGEKYEPLIHLATSKIQTGTLAKSEIETIN